MKKPKGLICVLPAAGSATRLNGIPKFLLPNRDGIPMINYHVSIAKEYASEVYVAVRPQLANLVKEILPPNAIVHIVETQTMTETIATLLKIAEPKMAVIQLPDTYIGNGEDFPSAIELSSKMAADVLIGFTTRSDQRGKLGQVDIRSEAGVLVVNQIADKDPNLHFGHHWGAVVLNSPDVNNWDLNLSHIGLVLQQEIERKMRKYAVISQQDYYDLGTISELMRFYSDAVQ
jgi:GTP:adenosylcobinamide-phosphate guanylyltransferase